MVPILLLVVSNVFMTVAWYGHLRHRETAMWKAILVSWLIAFVEYCFQVPANRLGYGRYSAFELKTIQEAVSLSVFVVFAVVYLKEEVKWNYLVGFALMVAAVFFVFKKWD
ncbi:MAG: DMT family protein [Bacteroidia bacterium]|nr:DMT family protein [Bacteroidia bacterium]MDW8335059.1 DMT family protein [Bacteroidia bacterium]